MSIVNWHNADAAVGNELAGMALRSIVKNLMMQRVTIPDLRMEGWAPPNLHFGPAGRQ